MFAFLRGLPAGAGADYIVIDVGGVGYKVFVPTPVLSVLHSEKEETTLYTYLHVREDAMQIFGFLAAGDLEIFELVIQVSGIGPKVALAILSAMPAAPFAQAVLQEQVDLLTKIPGVGKKTAQRMIIELKDKLGKMAIAGQTDAAGVLPLLSDQAGDALQALVALGYHAAEAKRALAKIPAGETGSLKTEELVRMALKELGRA